jgi:hypothetical protein
MRVNEEVLQCVVFICLPQVMPNGKKGTSFIGTAFFVGVPSNQLKGRSYVYLVTAKHVAERFGDKPFLLRVNDKKGSCTYVEVNGIPWFHHPTDESCDVAIIPLGLSQELFEYKLLPLDMFLSDEIIREKKIGIGDEVFITGLFVHATGSQRNQPIVRMGNIAMMPNEPVPTDLGDIDAYLIEARSIGGLSGSPTFVRETAIGLGKFYLLGLMHGHWDIPPEKKNDFLLSKEISGSVNMGIAIVVPAKKILEVLNHPVLVQKREEYEESYTIQMRQ